MYTATHNSVILWRQKPDEVLTFSEVIEIVTRSLKLIDFKSDVVIWEQVSPTLGPSKIAGILRYQHGDYGLIYIEMEHEL